MILEGLSHEPSSFGFSHFILAFIEKRAFRTKSRKNMIMGLAAGRKGR